MRLLQTALFTAAAALALSACADRDPVAAPGAPSLAGVPPEGGLGRPDELLDDDALRTPADPNAPFVDSATVTWILANHHPVRSLTSRRYDDLDLLRPLLEGKRLVQLGESSHGAREYNQSKVRLVKYLHERLGYDVVAFESGFYECARAGQRRLEIDSEEMMRRCLFSVWQTHEVKELFDYIRSTRHGGRPLRLAGIDVQIAQPLGNDDASALLRRVVGAVDPAFADRAAALDSAYVAAYARMLAGTGPVAVRWRPLQDSIRAGGWEAAYDSLARFFDDHAVALEDAFARDREALMLAKGTVRARRQSIPYALAITSGALSAILRAAGMADNVEFLLDEMFPGQKVIVWAHNAHVQHDRSKLFIPGIPTQQPRNMGSYLSQRRRHEMYTIGMFVYRGRVANNSRFAFPVNPPFQFTVESILYQARVKHMFVDLSRAPLEAGTAWMYFVRWMDLVNGTQLQVPREQFDGLWFVDTTTPPDYLYPPFAVIVR